MARRWHWPADDSNLQTLVVGPWTANDVMAARDLAMIMRLYSAQDQRIMMANFTPKFIAFVYFLLGDLEHGALRCRYRRRALEELGYVVVYQI